MIGNGKSIADFIQQLDATTRPIAEREFAMLLAEKRKTNPEETDLTMADSRYPSEQVRRSQYNFDSQAVRPYLAYDKVQQGILDTAAALFHVTFRQEIGVSAWDPSVETWDVIDTGRAIGRFISICIPGRASTVMARWSKS
jgi:thimet oligopeptidase